MLRQCGLIVVLGVAGCAATNYQYALDSAIHEGPSNFLERAVVGPQGDGTYIVATNQRIDPAGNTVLFPGRPVDIALSPDGAVAAVKNFREVVFFDVAQQSILQTLTMPKSGTSFSGIDWTADGNQIWVTDSDDAVHEAVRGADGQFAWHRSVTLPGPGGTGDSAPGGLWIDDAHGLLYVTMSRNNTVGIVNMAEATLDAEIPVGMAPFTVLPLGDALYVTNWGGRHPNDTDTTGPSSGSRLVVDPETGIASTGTVSVVSLASRQVVATIDTDLHPSAMALSPDQKTLYVANANSDTVSVIDTASNTNVGRISTKPMDALPFGSAPNALVVSPDGSTLYVANGGNNALAVIGLADGKIRGLIPTGWYPGAVLFDPTGTTLIVGNTKGVGGRDKAGNVERIKRNFGSMGTSIDGYNSHEHLGSLSFIPVPTTAELDGYTQRVAQNMRLPLIHDVMTQQTLEPKIVPVPEGPGETSPIKHVLYIIKENRTYDQIFGDMPQGNGDPGLCHFPREVTPNHHALAEQFVLLDNFYCNGVLSADGHQWTNEGYVTDYLEKSFGGFSRSYPYDGDDALAYASSGFIWDYVLRAGLSFRVYGEFVKANIEPKGVSWSDCYADYLDGTNKISIKATTELHTLEPYLCPTFIGFPGIVTDAYRAGEFIKELNGFEKSGDMPNFMIMLLPNDHTVGTRENMPTPRACVADNDLALGRIVEAVSKSRFWAETAIFVVQDDPQAGLDHVDGRRTVAFCISPYTKRGEVVSDFYNQSSMLRTMELILGLPPMNQLDMAADPMYACFTNTPDLTPYTAVPNNIPLDELNPKIASLRGQQRKDAIMSKHLPLDDIDQADEGTLNGIVWRSVKGYDTPYPVLERRAEVGVDAWPGVDPEAGEDDDD